MSSTLGAMVMSPSNLTFDHPRWLAFVGIVQLMELGFECTPMRGLVGISPPSSRQGTSEDGGAR